MRKNFRNISRNMSHQEIQYPLIPLFCHKLRLSIYLGQLCHYFNSTLKTADVVQLDALKILAIIVALDFLQLSFGQ